MHGLPNNKPLTIGAVAKLARVPLTTVRFSERAGVLRPPARSAVNYLLYHIGSCRPHPLHTMRRGAWLHLAGGDGIARAPFGCKQELPAGPRHSYRKNR